MTLTVICVFNGTKFDVSYVAKLKAMVARHLPIAHRFLCITDRPLGLKGVDELLCNDITKPSGWWMKMLLFSPRVRAYEGVDGPAIYIDLDMVICGDISPLAYIAGNYKFGICENFTKRAGHPNWPCKYGSAVMTFGKGWGQDIFDSWHARLVEWVQEAGAYGDQMIIEKLWPEAPLLQNMTPRGFFLGYRELEADYRRNRPRNTSVIVFAGKNRPDNCTIPWVAEEWRV